MTGEEFDRSVRRMYRWMAAIAVAGSAALLAARGPRWGGGFLVGAAGSAMLFHWFRRIVGALAPGADVPSRPRLAWLGGLRYAIIGGVAYGLVRVVGVEPTAVGLGLLTMMGAALVEIGYLAVRAFR